MEEYSHLSSLYPLERKAGLLPPVRKVRTTMGVQTAMIIDDDIDLASLLCYTLGNRKIHSMAVHSLAEAADYLNRLKPTVIFLDNSFPEGLGINFIKQIRNADDAIKIIMMTADADHWIEEKAKAEGVVRFLKKPLTTQVVNEVLDELNMRKV